MISAAGYKDDFFAPRIFFSLFSSAFFPLGKEDFLHQQNVSTDDLLIYSIFLSFFSLYEVTINFF